MEDTEEQGNAEMEVGCVSTVVAAITIKCFGGSFAKRLFNSAFDLRFDFNKDFSVFFKMRSRLCCSRISLFSLVNFSFFFVVTVLLVPLPILLLQPFVLKFNLLTSSASHDAIGLTGAAVVLSTVIGNCWFRFLLAWLFITTAVLSVVVVCVGVGGGGACVCVVCVWCCCCCCCSTVVFVGGVV